MNLTNRLLVCLGMCVSLSTSSEAAQFIPLGFADSSASNFQTSSATGVDATGQTVVGQSYLNAQSVAFVWRQSTGMQPLESSNGATMATAITPDGQTIVGHAKSSLGPASFVTNTSQGFTPINNATAGPMGGGGSDVSADGKIVVGWSPTANNVYEPYRWTQQNGMQFLTDLQGGTSPGIASAISPDGSVIVGEWGTFFQPEAFRWTAAQGVVRLGDLAGGDVFSRAYGASSNGQVIVGLGTTDKGKEAFRWDQTSGMVGLGFLPSRPQESVALAVTPDGSAIVGGSGDFLSGSGNQSAFVWDAAHGMRSLQNLLNADSNLVGNLTGWNLGSATAISANGQAIVGNGLNPQGKYEAFLVLLDAPLGVPEPSSLGMCITWCALALGVTRQRRGRVGETQGIAGA